jgi:hypothetical protein
MVKKLIGCLFLLLVIVTAAYAADQAISARTELAAAPATDDILPIYDTSTTSGKRITVANLMKALGSAVSGLTVHADNLAANLKSIAGLTLADVSIIEGTGDGATAVVTSGGANRLLGSNSDNSALEFKSTLTGLTFGGFTTSAGMVPLTDASGNLVNSYLTVAGPASTMKTKTFSNGNATVMEEGVSHGGYIFGDTTPDADGEVGYASNTYLWFANSEDLKVTASANMWTWDSNTSAAFTFTPAVTVTGTLTANGTLTTTGATNIGDGGDDIHILLKKTVSDGTWSGTTVNLTCHETIAFGKPVFVNSDGEAALANATAASTMPAIGLAVVGGNAADTCTILIHGIVAETDWTWTPGGTIYVDDSASGVLTATVGDVSGTDHVVQIMGIALHADAMLVNPSFSTITLE